MNLPTWDDLPHLPLVLIGLLVYVGVALAAWTTMRPLLPRSRMRLAPWSVFEVIAAFFLVMILIPAISDQLFVSMGLGDVLYGSDMMKLVRSTEKGDEVKQARMRLHLVVSVLALPLQVFAVLRFLRFVSDTRPYQLGLTAHRARTNVLLGVLGWLIVAPPVLALFVLVSQLFLLLSPSGVREHSFEQLSQSGLLTPAEYGLIVFLAMVAAPVLEELLFRGVLLGWLTRHREGSHAIIGLCLVWTLYDVGVEHGQVVRGGSLNERILVLAPVLFVLLLLPLYWWINQRQRTAVPTALFASSLLFAMVHSAWPSPVALFVLALGLAWLAWRTQSLIGPMVLHSLFNGIACVQLLNQ